MSTTRESFEEEGDFAYSYIKFIPIDYLSALEDGDIKNFQEVDGIKEFNKVIESLAKLTFLKRIKVKGSNSLSNPELINKNKTKKDQGVTNGCVATAMIIQNNSLRQHLNNSHATSGSFQDVSKKPDKDAERIALYTASETMLKLQTSKFNKKGDTPGVTLQDLEDILWSKKTNIYMIVLFVEAMACHSCKEVFEKLANTLKVPIKFFYTASNTYNKLGEQLYKITGSDFFKKLNKDRSGIIGIAMPTLNIKNPNYKPPIGHAKPIKSAWGKNTNMSSSSNSSSSYSSSSSLSSNSSSNQSLQFSTNLPLDDIKIIRDVPVEISIFKAINPPEDLQETSKFGSGIKESLKDTLKITPKHPKSSKKNKYIPVKIDASNLIKGIGDGTMKNPYLIKTDNILSVSKEFSDMVDNYKIKSQNKYLYEVVNVDEPDIGISKEDIEKLKSYKVSKIFKYITENNLTFIAYEGN